STLSAEQVCCGLEQQPRPSELRSEAAAVDLDPAPRVDDTGNAVLQKRPEPPRAHRLGMDRVKATAAIGFWRWLFLEHARRLRRLATGAPRPVLPRSSAVELEVSREIPPPDAFDCPGEEGLRTHAKLRAGSFSLSGSGTGSAGSVFGSSAG